MWHITTCTLHSRPSAARAETVANVFDCEARQARERDGKVNRERSDCGRKGARAGSFLSGAVAVGTEAVDSFIL